MRVPKIEKKKYFLYIEFLIFILIGIYFYKINKFTPYWNDDYANSFVYGTLRKIKNFNDIGLNQYIIYSSWTGRVVSTFFITIFMYLGKSIFNIINTLIILFLIYMIKSYCDLEENYKNTSMIFLIVFLLWYGVPSFGETITWMTGAIVYLWITFLSVTYILYIKNLLLGKDKLANRPMSLILLTILGFVAGNSVENFASVCLSLVLVTFIYIRYIKKEKLPLWFYISSISAIIGFIVLIAAPGNYRRLANSPQKAEFKTMMINFLISLKSVLIEQKIIILIFFILVIICVNKLKKENFKEKKGEIFISIFFFALSILSYLVMIVSPEFPVRASFPGAILIIISDSILASLLLGTIKNRVIINLLPVLLIIILFPSMKKVYNGYFQLNEASLKRIQIIQQYQKNNEKDVYLPGLNVNGNRYMYVRDVLPGPNEDQNKTLARYYGFNSVKLKSKVEIILGLDSTQKDFYQIFYKNQNSDSNNLMRTSYNGAVTDKAYFGCDYDTVEFLSIRLGTKKEKKVIKYIVINENGKSILFKPNDIIKMFKPLSQVGSFKVTENGLEVQCLGDNPQFELQGIDNYINSGDYLELTIDGNNIYNYQVFFDRGTGYSESDSVVKDLKQYKSINNTYTLRFYINNVQDINNIRIDPGNKGEKLAIKSLKLHINNKEYYFERKELINTLKPYAQIGQINMTNNGDLEINTLGNDPQLELLKIQRYVN